MEFRLLGPLEVRAGNGPLPLGGEKQRALLALLLLNANRVVSRERLIDELWGEEPPATAVTTVQVYVSRLRKLLPAGALVTRGRGYALDVPPEDVDLLCFERLRAAGQFHEALSLWRGAALAEFVEPFARVEAARLEELRLAALEERIDADLAEGRHAELVAELKALISAHPHRERLRGQLMLAFYRCGRQPEALAAYRSARAALDELGVGPGAKLRRLEQQILTQDAALDLPLERLLSSEGVPLPGPLVPSSPFPFVGRAHELARLRGRLERAEEGEGAVVLITGEAGSGKTRLVRELAHEAAARGMLVLYGTSDATVSIPYQPLREWLEFLLRVCDPDALAECLRDGRLARLVPALARLTGTEAQAAGDPEADRYLVQSAAAEALTKMARVQPLLLVADDLHWADSETVHLLRRLARTAPEARMLIVAAFRDPGGPIAPALADTLADVSRLDAVTRVPLGSLGVSDVAEFIRRSTGADVSVELAAQIGELTDGTPLLLCELWRDLRENNAVEVSRGVRLSLPVSELRGPGRIRDFVRQRLSRLAPQTRALVELAAVAGTRCEALVLGHAAGIERPALLAGLDEAAAAGFLEARPGPAPAWHFTHELMRRAIYDRLDAARRASLHLRVGEALEQMPTDDINRVLPELAHHFTLAVALAGADRAVAYNLRAGDAAIAAAAYDEGAARLSTALALGIADPGQRIRTQVQVAYLLRDAGRASEAEPLFDESLEAANAFGERGVAARVRLHRALTALNNMKLGAEGLQTVAEEALETFRQAGDWRGVADAGRHIAHGLRRRGRVAEAELVLEDALEAADASGDELVRRQVIGSLCFVLWAGPAPVHEAIPRCEALLEASGDRALQAAVSRSLSALCAMARRFDEAREHLGRSGPILDEVNEVANSSVYRQAAAEAKELMGDLGGAEQELKVQWLRFRDDSAFADNGLQAAHRLALMYCNDGRWADAERCLAYGRAFPEPTHFTQAHALGLAGRARVSAHRGEFAEALALARRGVEVADLSDMLNVRARVWLALADVQHAHGHPGAAEDAAATALALYEEKGNVGGAAQVRAARDARVAS